MSMNKQVQSDCVLTHAGTPRTRKKGCASAGKAATLFPIRNQASGAPLVSSSTTALPPASPATASFASATTLQELEMANSSSIFDPPFALESTTSASAAASKAPESYSAVMTDAITTASATLSEACALRTHRKQVQNSGNRWGGGGKGAMHGPIFFVSSSSSSLALLPHLLPYFFPLVFFHSFLTLCHHLH